MIKKSFYLVLKDIRNYVRQYRIKKQIVASIIPISEFKLEEYGEFGIVIGI
jgi:hypothetical protein